MKTVLAGVEVLWRLGGMVAEGEEQPVRVPVEVGVDNRAFGQLAREEDLLAWNALPVLEND